MLFFKKRLKDISISRKLYFTVSIMALLVIIELFTLAFAVSTLSSVRSFVAGEGLWSKAEKDAVLYLNLYAYSHKEKDYQAFLQFLKVPMGDRIARLELQKQNPDLAIASRGLLEGRNHPDDIDGMNKLILRYHNVYYIKKAFTLWVAAEPVLFQLTQIAENIHKQIAKGARQKDIDRSLIKVTILNDQLTKLEDGFSFALGEGARWLEGLVLKVLLALSLTIGSTSIITTISVSKAIKKGLNAIIDGAILISKGQLNKRVEVYSGDEIGTLAVAFNQMTDRLEQNVQEINEKEKSLQKERERVASLEKVKQLFLMNMSHEIRTPMNVILGFAHLLEDSLTNQEHQEYAQLLIKAGDELLMLLNDILDFSKMESGEVILENAPFSMEQMIHSIINENEPKAEAKKIHLGYYVDKRIPGVILGDAIRLNQVLTNLLSNAIKFTDNGEVNISVYCINDYQHHLEVEFSVKDTGIGISDEQQNRIFESFEQAMSGTERRFGGTGLGLSIVKQLVELQGGKVFVNSTLGRGSEFHFRISFLKVKHIKEQSEEGISSSINEAGTVNTASIGPKVLIVDDSPINRFLVIKLLQRKGFETDVAENGKIGLFKCSNNTYDLILMDLQMPEMDGYEAAKQIRGLADNKKDVPIIAITAHAIEGEKERCLALGMNDIISKPFNPGELYEKIENLLKQHA